MRLPVYKPLYLFLKAIGFPVVWEVSIGAVIFKQEAEQRSYLLLHYPSGHFDFVKGHVEIGETEETTLRRETEEETGITDISIYPYRVSIRYFYIAKGAEREKRLKSGHGIWIFKQVHFYPVITKTDDVRISHEHIGFIWLPYDKAVVKATFDNARRVLEKTEIFLRAASDIR
jgi:bis(5'-nucleosidyl)-tetraphosphatase